MGLDFPRVQPSGVSNDDPVSAFEPGGTIAFSFRRFSSPDCDLGMRCETICGGSLQPTNKNRKPTQASAAKMMLEEIGFLNLEKSTIKDSEGQRIFFFTDNYRRYWNQSYRAIDLADVNAIQFVRDACSNFGQPKLQQDIMSQSFCFQISICLNNEGPPIISSFFFEGKSIRQSFVI